MFDWTVNLGNLIIFFTTIMAGVGFVYTMRGRIDAMSARLLVLETDLKKLIEVLIEQGKQSERMTAMDQRMVAQGQRLDDLIKRFNEVMDHSK